MMRERIEDLGRIQVVTQQVARHDIFTCIPGRKKDFPQYFESLDENAKTDLLLKIVYGLEEVYDQIMEILNISEGTDSLNERVVY